MPKDEPHLLDIKEKRLERRKSQAGKVSHGLSIRTLGNGCIGGVKSLAIITDYRTYVFNCSEAVQRRFFKGNANVSALSDVFITQKCWQNVGGLPGMCLTARSVGVPHITLHGPKGCVNLFSKMKNFLTLNVVTVDENNIVEKPHKDDTVRVDAIKIAYSGEVPMPELPEEFFTNIDSRQSSRGRNPYDTTLLAYLVTFSPKLARLQLNKCVSLGVPVGPLLGQLKAGKDVKLECGKVVYAKDVLEKAAPASRSLIIDCPSKAYLDGVTDNERLRFTEEDNLIYAFHLAPQHIIVTEKYVQWMKKAFPASVQHVLFNEGCQDLGSENSFQFIRCLRAIGPHYFPETTHYSQEEAQIPEQLSALKVVYGVSGMDFRIRPAVKLDHENVPKYDTEKWHTDDEKSEALKMKLESILKRPRTPLSPFCLSQPAFPRVTFLGTGSSVPSRYRNVSAILVETKPDCFVLLDSGEGTLEQMHRQFGPERRDSVLRNLRAVYHSHKHADHHLGFFNVLLARQRAFKAVGQEEALIYLLTSGSLTPFSLSYHENYEPVLRGVRFVSLERLRLVYPPAVDPEFSQDQKPAPIQKVQPILKDDLAALTTYLGLSSLVCCWALHCRDAYCVSLTTAEHSYKLMYTGDTRPCRNIEELASYEQPPDLLIHEATLEHYLLEDAEKKMHSTFTEAVNNGKALKAKYTILTHFSQRYHKIPPFKEIEHEKNIGIAFDHMTVTPQNKWQIRDMYADLQIAFSDVLEDLQEREDKTMERVNDLKRPQREDCPVKSKKAKSPIWL